MKRIALAAAGLFVVATPVGASATTTSKQAICEPVIVDTADGPVTGLLCLPQGSVL